MNTVKCGICQTQIESPVLLPCSHSICAKHSAVDAQQEGSATTTTIICNECNIEHQLPSNGENFPANTTLAEAFEAQKNEEERKKVMASLQKLQATINEAQAILENPQAYIEMTVNKLKEEVRAKGEAMKLKVMQESELLINGLDELQQERQMGFSNVN